MSVVRPRLHHHCPYQHYQMLHRNYDSDYGNSVFNYTYNFNGGNICGGGFWGGIWGGIGMGIGNLLGGLFGGLMGGYGMGGFGFGMGGFSPFGGGFGMGGYSPLSSWGVNNSQNTGNNGTNQSSTKIISNKDTRLIGGYTKDVEKLAKDTAISKQKILDLYNKIKDSFDKQDDIEKDADTKVYEHLLNHLKALGKKYGLEEKDGKLEETEPEVTDYSQINDLEALLDILDENPDAVNSKEFNDAFNRLLENANPDDLRAFYDNYKNKLTETQLQVLKNKIDKAATEASTQEDDETSVVTNTHSYLEGHENATDEDISKIKKGTKLDIIDTSEIEDFNGTTVTDFSNNVITVKTTSGINIQYKYITTTKSGEKIFMSNKNHQHYVLQKRTDGSLALMQYSWHKGHNVGDVTSGNRTLDNGFPEDEEKLKEQD